MQDKQMFIDNLAHEMKTPLTSILGYSEYLQNAMNNEEERIKAAGHLRNSAKRLQSLSSALLDLAYTREKIILKDIDTEHLFQALDDLMKHSLTERKLKLDITIHTPIICGDESLLLSLLSNLIENAARASIEGGIIKVSAYKKENLILEVSDVGFGMDENEILKITEPFYRVDKSRSRADGGIGLGMSICKQIAQLHNAELKIKSRPDIGTTVQLIFTSL